MSLRHRKVMMKTDSLIVKSGISGNYGNRAWFILSILLEIRRMEALLILSNGVGSLETKIVRLIWRLRLELERCIG
ncbi:hypothetical protein PRUPE_4G177800 [Prunus persica]|uniref:Uncharacterized protein n=1 Tax=Prunus persica TaxID=3760 RepID=A0A251PMB2_PRUPE|nr:hypothetical protein PRUPE_4G177800 [Prunus persica]